MGERPSFALSLAASAEAPREARRALRGVLAPSLAPIMLADAELLLSELVSNSVEYGTAGEEIDVAAVRREDSLRVEVTDRGPGFVGRPAAVSADAPRGRGLALVERVASRWGIAPGRRFVVWFEIDLADGAGSPTGETPAPAGSVDVLDGECARIVLRGEVDVATLGAPSAGEWEHLLAQECVELDLSEVTFIDSTGLAFISGVARRAADAGVRLSVSGASATAQRALALTGLDRVLGGVR